MAQEREKELSYKMSPEREALLAEIIDDTRGSRLDSVHIHNFVREEVTSALKEKHKGHLTIMKSEINQVLEGVEKIVREENYKLEEWYSSTDRPNTISVFDANQRNMATRNKILLLLSSLKQ